ncbi:GNAT family N-acetyltransferase [Siminovitchia sp. FSL H7-0308]|uniref:GNAT family N-acetyltransferase n=1 Tax=Siminovitchia sp. FSL H7-0308 TaxID=2921432 RepID=UPI0030EEECDC
MDFKIVPFNDQDESALIELLRFTNQYDDTQYPQSAQALVSFFQETDTNKNVFLMKNKAVDIIGFIGVDEIPNRQRARIYGIIHPAFRRQGLGTLLLNHITTHIKSLENKYRIMDLVGYEQVKEFKFFAENNGFKLARKFIEYKKILNQKSFNKTHLASEFKCLNLVDYNLLKWVQFFNQVFENYWGLGLMTEKAAFQRFNTVNYDPDLDMILINNDSIVGFVCCDVVNGIPELSFIGVKTEYQSKGIASFLINELCSRLEKKNFSKVIAMADQNSRNGIHTLLKRKNFRPFLSHVAYRKMLN